MIGGESFTEAEKMNLNEHPFFEGLPSCSLCPNIPKLRAKGFTELISFHQLCSGYDPNDFSINYLNTIKTNTHHLVEQMKEGTHRRIPSKHYMSAGKIKQATNIGINVCSCPSNAVDVGFALKKALEAMGKNCTVLYMGGLDEDRVGNHYKLDCIIVVGCYETLAEVYTRRLDIDPPLYTILDALLALEKIPFDSKMDFPHHTWLELLE
ncbi:hypothetical protein PCE1_000662 [Barthelona sp. PCE]